MSLKEAEQDVISRGVRNLDLGGGYKISPFDRDDHSFVEFDKGIRITVHEKSR